MRKINLKIVSLFMAQAFLFTSLAYPEACLRKPLDSVSGYLREFDAMRGAETAAGLDEIIRRLDSGDEEALGDLFDLSKRAIPGTIFTIAKIDKVFSEKRLEQGVLEGHIIPLTDFVKIDGAKITKGVPKLLNILIKLGIIDPRFEAEDGLCMVPMRETDPSNSGGSSLHGRSLNPDKFDIEKGILIWKGNGESQLNQGLPFNTERYSIDGGMTTREVDANIKASQRLENALSEARRYDPSIPEDLFITPAVSFVPLYVYLQKSREDLSGEGLKIIKEGENSLAGAFIPVDKIIPFLKKFGGLTEKRQELWQKAIKEMRFFAYASPAPWRTRELWLHLDFFQKKFGTDDRKEIFYNLIRRYALIAAIVHKKMDMIASNRLILKGHRLASIFSETNMGYAAFDYATLASREEFLEEYIKQVSEGQIEVGQQELEKAAGAEFEKIWEEELNILKEDTIRYTAQGILETYDENDIVEALRYFDGIYEAFGSADVPSALASNMQVRVRVSEDAMKTLRFTRRTALKLLIAGVGYKGAQKIYKAFDPSDEVIKKLNNFIKTPIISRRYSDDREQYRYETRIINNLHGNKDNRLRPEDFRWLSGFLTDKRRGAIEFAARTFNLEPELLAAFLFEEEFNSQTRNKLKEFLKEGLSGFVSKHRDVEHAGTVGLGQVSVSHVLNERSLHILYANQAYFLKALEGSDKEAFEEFIEFFKPWDEAVGRALPGSIMANLAEKRGNIVNLAEIEEINIFFSASVIRGETFKIAEDNSNVTDIPGVMPLLGNSTAWSLSEKEYQVIQKEALKKRYGVPFGNIAYYHPLMRYFAVSQRYSGAVYSYGRGITKTKLYVMFLASGIFKQKGISAGASGALLQNKEAGKGL